MGLKDAEEAGGSPPPPAGAATGAPLLIDQFLPRYDFAVADAAILRAPSEACYRAVRNIDLARHPVIGMLLDLRALPSRFRARRKGAPRSPARRTFRLDEMVGPPMNWILLGEEADVEFCLGQIGRPWKLSETPSDEIAGPGEFASFNRPGFAKIALSLRVAPYGATSSILTLETRVALTDAESRKRFGRYWAVIGPFSSLVRRMAIRMVAAELRRGGVGRSEAR